MASIPDRAGEGFSQLDTVSLPPRRQLTWRPDSVTAGPVLTAIPENTFQEPLTNPSRDNHDRVAWLQHAPECIHLPILDGNAAGRPVGTPRAAENLDLSAQVRRRRRFAAEILRSIVTRPLLRRAQPPSCPRRALPVRVAEQKRKPSYNLSRAVAYHPPPAPRIFTSSSAGASSASSGTSSTSASPAVVSADASGRAAPGSDPVPSPHEGNPPIAAAATARKPRQAVGIRDGLHRDAVVASLIVPTISRRPGPRPGSARRRRRTPRARSRCRFPACRQSAHDAEYGGCLLSVCAISHA
jgi:hypothetical protein